MSVRSVGLVAVTLLSTGACAGRARRTAPATPPVVIVAAGDIACSEEQRAKFGGPEGCQDVAMAALAAAQNPRAVLVLGDNQYPVGTLETYRAGYEKSFGKLKAITYPTPGNHEYKSLAEGYYAYFGERAGPRGLGYYSFELGRWHVVSLNSNCGAVSCAPDDAQVRWLKADLAAHPSACTLAYFHAPRFSSGEHGNDTRVAPLFEALHAGGVDVILNAHDHIYERFAPLRPDGERDDAHGIREFVVGTGGFNHYPVHASLPVSETRLNDAFGILRMELSADGYTWAFVTAKGVADQGSGRCH